MIEPKQPEPAKSLLMERGKQRHLVTPNAYGDLRGRLRESNRMVRPTLLLGEHRDFCVVALWKTEQMARLNPACNPFFRSSKQ